MNTILPASRSSAGFRIDPSRGRVDSRVASEWFARPDDERYLSLGDLHAATLARAERAQARTIESRAIHVEASRDSAERLTLAIPGQPEPVAPTHWSFGQLASLVGAPSSYLRDLPAPLAAINLQHGLLSHRAELVKTLETTTLYLAGLSALRFHPSCYYRPDDDGPTETWPALIAAVTDLDGMLTGVHRTWLAADGRGKAPVDVPRRAMGDLLGHAVRFGVASDVLGAGEGIETVLSLRQVLPDLPLAACLSSAHLGALIFPPLLRRLYVLRDADPAGDHAVAALDARAAEAGIELVALSSRFGDFNDDLRHLGRGALRAILHSQLAPPDVARFLEGAGV